MSIHVLIAEHIHALKQIGDISLSVEYISLSKTMLQYWANRSGAYQYVGMIEILQTQLKIISRKDPNRELSSMSEQHIPFGDPDLLNKIRDTIYTTAASYLKWQR